MHREDIDVLPEMSVPRAAAVVLVTCEYPPFPGGIGTYAGALVQAVRAAGLSMSVIAPSYPQLPAVADEDTHRILGHHRIGPAAALETLRILRRASPHAIVLAADIRSVLMLHLLRRLHGRAYRAMVHGSEASKFRPRSLVFRLVRRAYLSADAVVFNSRATQRVFEAGIGVPARGIVAYLGLDLRWFEPAGGALEHEALRELPATASVVCTVGRIEARKGQIQSLRALALARDRHGLREPVYVMAGLREDHAYADAVLVEGKKLGVPVIEAGRLPEPDVKRLYRRAACHALCAQDLPGKLEGFGLVLLEAAAQGCPSVATASGGIPEVLGDTGKVLPIGDLDAAARAFAAYARDAKLRADDGSAALERARTFTWDACVRATFPELFHAEPKRRIS